MLDYCPELFEFPAMSIGWSQLHFVYSRNRISIYPTFPDYICYDKWHCPTSQSDIHFTKISDPSLSLSCTHLNRSDFPKSWLLQIKSIRSQMHRQCSLNADADGNYCPENTQFKCGNKCLSKHRLVDQLNDCLNSIDEQRNDSCTLNHKHRLTCTNNITGTEITKCFPNTMIFMGNRENCRSRVKLPHFPTLCDGYVTYREKVGQDMETDETHCERWLCDNQYTRCDGIWNCRNGADEAQCFHPVCNGSRGHPCLLRNTSALICLAIENINDGIIDCLGATDEQQACRNLQSGRTSYRCLINNTVDKQLTNE